MSGSVALDPVLLREAPNFRDLGGIPLGDGRRFAAGRVYRSEGLHALTEDGAAALGRLGVRLVCDLRTPGERTRYPSRWPDHSAPEILEIEGGMDLRTIRRERMRQLFDDPSGGRARRFMREIYAQMPDVYGPALGLLAEGIADRGELPAVVHCTAGKDRTGFVCSLLLLAVGADRDEIERDYVASDDFYGPERMRAIIAERAGADPPAPVVDAFRSDFAYLEVAFDAVRERHGSVDAFLAHVGIDPARRERLREALTESRGE